MHVKRKTLAWYGHFGHLPLNCTKQKKHYLPKAELSHRRLINDKLQVDRAFLSLRANSCQIYFATLLPNFCVGHRPQRDCATDVIRVTRWLKMHIQDPMHVSFAERLLALQVKARLHDGISHGTCPTHFMKWFTSYGGDYTVRFWCAFSCPTNRLSQRLAQQCRMPLRQTVCRTWKRTSKTHRVIDP
jgi:hypothetical protein